MAKNESKQKNTKAIEKAQPPREAASYAKEWFNNRGDTLAKWCVKDSGLDALALIRIGTMVVQREEKFHDPKSWPSLYIALITAGQLGLEPPLERA